LKRIMAYPYAVWMLLFILIPLGLVLYYSFTAAGGSGGPAAAFSLSNFGRAFEPIYVSVLWRSLALGLVSTGVCLLLGYPVAYIMSGRELSKKSFLIFLFLVPMWMNFLLRTYAWLSILEQNGFVNTLLSDIGLPKINILYTEKAVVLGMVYNFLPFMILPIHTVLTKIDRQLIEAAQDLGANSVSVFFRLVFPLSLPGVVSGVTMVFLPAVTTFVISDLLGGNKTQLVGNVIEQQFLLVNDWNFGSALSVILMLVILATMAVFSALDNRSEGGALF